MIALTIVIFLLVLGLLVFVHELGHFLAARLAGIKVEEFAFGFPPRILSKVTKGTRYSWNLLPLGGYVRLLGEEESSHAPNAYSSKPPAVRLAVVVAGVAMNLLLAWFILTIWFALTIARPPTNAVVVAQVVNNSAAAQAGLLAGDIVLTADGLKIMQAEQLARFTREHLGQKVTFALRRFGSDVSKEISLGELPAPLGVAPIDLGALPEGLKLELAPVYAAGEVFSTVVGGFAFIGQAIGSLLGGPAVEGEVTGPIGIFGYLSQMVSLGPLYLTRFVATLSLLVGFFNILPIPALDGGKAIFVLSELISRRRIIREHVEQTVHFIGFVLLIGVLIVITYRDIVRLVTNRL